MSTRFRSASDTEVRRYILTAATASLLVLAVLFEAFPNLDLAVSLAVKNACAGSARFGGWCHENGVLSIPRGIAMALPVAVVLLAVVLAIRAWRAASHRATHARNVALFLVACFVAGPGLLSNVILKDHWGRARPREVVELGGQKQFTPPLVPSSACTNNCSFVSGEASAVFAMLFAAALVFTRRWRTLLALGVAAGLLTGLIRISMGGHFASDVLFAGGLMALVAAATHAVVFSSSGLWGGLAGLTGSRHAFSAHPRPDRPALEAQS